MEKCWHKSKLDIKWCHIILGLNENNDLIINKARNNILTIIAYAIYKSWVVIDDNKVNYKYIDISQKIKQSLFIYVNIYTITFLYDKKWFKVFKSLTEKIISDHID